jgi:hypothetical protein
VKKVLLFIPTFVVLGAIMFPLYMASGVLDNISLLCKIFFAWCNRFVEWATD